MSALAVENVTVAFDRVVALEDVSVSGEPGSVTAVIGPNAAGKSTLLRICAGLLRPARGSVRINALSVRSLSPRQLAACVAYVPQRPVVTAAFTVREVVALGRYALSRRPDRIDESISALELESLADSWFHELSVGQQQRVTLARALAQHETGGVILLDEPTSAMDLEHARRARAELRRLAERGATVVIALHDVAAAASFADRAWLMDRGRLVASGPTSDTLSSALLESIFSVRFEQARRDTGEWILINPD